MRPFATLLVLLALPPVTSAGGPALAHDTTAFVGDGTVEVPLATCSGNSPLIPICTTGVYTTDLSFGFGFSWSGNYRGTLENRLDYLGNSFVFKCVINGAAFSCSLAGRIPSPGTLVLHDCRSLDSATGALGGTGSWRCSFFP